MQSNYVGFQVLPSSHTLTHPPFSSRYSPLPLSIRLLCELQALTEPQLVPPDLYLPAKDSTEVVPSDMTRLKDGEPMPDGIEAKMLAWGADPDKYRAMCDLLLTTMAQKVIDLEKSGQERDRRLQQLESEVKAIKENDIAITKKLGELSAHLSEVMIKFNTWKNSVSASDRMTEKLRTEFAQMLQDLQAISSRLQDLESRAIDKDSAKQLHRDLTSAIASFDEQYDKMSRLAESTDSPEKVAFLECPVEEGIAGASGKFGGYLILL